MWILTRRSPQDCSVRVHITTVAAVRWATDLCGSLSRILAVSWSQCVCVCVCRLSSVACVSDAGLPGVSQIVGPVRLGLGACWRRLHHCVSLFVCYLSATCLLPAACCLLPAACLPPAMCCVFHRCVFLLLLCWEPRCPSLVATPFPLFILNACVPPECFLLT